MRSFGKMNRRKTKRTKERRTTSQLPHRLYLPRCPLRPTMMTMMTTNTGKPALFISPEKRQLKLKYRGRQQTET